MKTFKFILSLLLFAAFIFNQTSDAQSVVSEKNLPNFKRINADLYRGGQPNEAGIKELKALGVKTVIDLRSSDDNARKEETLVRNAGMNFINKPLNNWLRPKNSEIEEIEKLINAPENQPVFVHCKRGADRTGTVIAVYRLTHDNWSAKRAEDEAEDHHFGWWQFQMKDFINDYADKVTKKK